MPPSTPPELDGEAQAQAKLAQYRPIVLDMLMAMALGENGEPVETRRRALVDLAKLGFRPAPEPPTSAVDQLEQRLIEHFEQYQTALAEADPEVTE